MGDNDTNRAALSTTENDERPARGCIAQTYWYDKDGVQRAVFCERAATIQVRSMDSSRNDACDEHGAQMIEAGARKIRDLNSPTGTSG